MSEQETTPVVQVEQVEVVHVPVSEPESVSAQVSEPTSDPVSEPTSDPVSEPVSDPVVDVDDQLDDEVPAFVPKPVLSVRKRKALMRKMRANGTFEWSSFYNEYIAPTMFADLAQTAQPVSFNVATSYMNEKAQNRYLNRNATKSRTRRNRTGLSFWVSYRNRK